ncbi:hypothetical protein KLJ63_07135 [Vibrio splendidus]|nr:hypothetical protein KLJ63_07135 [Vibrio splendidus]
MIIRKIELISDSKSTAVLEFNKGLNVIVGPSNTGKSYVIQCIKYVFGASKKPKKIKESKGYTDVKITLEHKGDFTIITRDLEIGKTVEIEEIAKGESISSEFKIQHAKGLGNLSNYFLEKFEVNDKLLLKGKEKLTSSSMSLRVLEQVLVMDEARIVGEHSPLGSGDKGDKTLEASFLRTLLTNLDDFKVKEILPIIKEYEKNNKKIKALQDIVDTIYPYKTKSLEGEKLELEANVNRLEIAYKSTNERIMNFFSSSKEQVDLKEKTIKDIEVITNQLREYEVLKSRFSLLIEKYISDKDRLIAINESTKQFQYYDYIACPTCDQSLSESNIVDTEKMLSILDSTFAEIEKINGKVEDLKLTIFDVENNIELSKSDLDELQSELIKIDRKVKNSVSQFDMNEFNSIHSSIIKERQQLYKIEYKISEKLRIISEIDLLKENNIGVDVSYYQSGFVNEKNIFAKTVENILKRWGFPEYTPTIYDETTRDLIIGGSPRSDFGKGYRAISCSAYMIGLMESMGERHPSFVILDSPITTFKDTDKETGDELDPYDEISEDVIYSFYSDLCESYLDKQIIIFENREPDPALVNQMNYKQFTRKKTSGRYGFFPV